MLVNTLKNIYRWAVPAAVRQAIRRDAREIPVRLRDLSADLKERLLPGPVPLPPAYLRGRVGITSSRAEFLQVGERCKADIVAEVARVTDDLSAYRRWLDFGCGAGRVARHLDAEQHVQFLTGIDIDAAAIRWSQRHLTGEYFVTSPLPPTPFSDAAFDLVYAVSVFTHFEEAMQFAWLSEIRRLLRPGGLFVATTQPETLTYNRSDLSTEDHLRLQNDGFVFRRGFGLFNEDSAFQSPEYLRREWPKFLEPVVFKRAGLMNYLDLSIWRR